MGLTRRTLVAGAAGAAVAGVLSPPERAAAATEEDLAWLRLGVAAELLSVDFYRRALGTRHLSPRDRRVLRAARLADADHYRRLAAVLAAGGGAPVDAADFSFGYPGSGFASRARLAAAGVAIERASVGAALGALAEVADPAARRTLASVASADGAHLASWLSLSGRGPGAAFPPPFSIDRASAELAPFSATDGEGRLYGQRGRPRARDQPRHAPPLGPERADHCRARRGEPARRRRRRDRTAEGRAARHALARATG